MSDAVLLPCPFCAAPGQMHHDTSSDYESHWEYHGRCSDMDCWGDSGGAKTPEEAAALWNRREPMIENATYGRDVPSELVELPSAWRDFRKQRPSPAQVILLSWSHDDALKAWNYHICLSDFAEDASLKDAIAIYWQPLPAPPTEAEIEAAKREGEAQ